MTKTDKAEDRAGRRQTRRNANHEEGKLSERQTRNKAYQEEADHEKGRQEEFRLRAMKTRRMVTSAVKGRRSKVK